MAKYLDKNDSSATVGAHDLLVRSVYLVSARQGFAGLQHQRVGAKTLGWNEAGLFEHSGMEVEGSGRRSAHHKRQDGKYGFARVRSQAEVDARGEAMVEQTAK